MTERDFVMRVFWMVLAVASSSLVIEGGAETTAMQAFEERKETSIRLCTSTVAKRTGSSNLYVYNTLSFENKLSVWIEVRPERSQFRCTVVKNGPSSYYIKSVRKY